MLYNRDTLIEAYESALKNYVTLGLIKHENDIDTAPPSEIVGKYFDAAKVDNSPAIRFVPLKKGDKVVGVDIDFGEHPAATAG